MRRVLESLDLEVVVGARRGRLRPLGGGLGSGRARAGSAGGAGGWLRGAPGAFAPCAVAGRAGGGGRPPAPGAPPVFGASPFWPSKSSQLVSLVPLMPDTRRAKSSGFEHCRSASS